MLHRSFTIETVEPRRLMVRLLGELDEDGARALTEALVPGNIGTGWHLLMDLTAFEGCSYDTRMLLAELQRALAERDVRTAFIAIRPRFRGMALWISHVAEDPNARAFHRLEQAEAWLASTAGRLQALVNYFSRPSGRGGDSPYAHETPSQRMRRLRKRRSSSSDGGSG